MFLTLFNKLGLEKHFENLQWRLLENIRSHTLYGIEQAYFVRRIK